MHAPRLIFGVVAGPIVALINQQAIYAGDMWACGHAAHAALHVVPALCLVAALAVSYSSYAAIRTIGDDRSDDSHAARLHFLGLLGAAIALFSALVIAAQWLGIFVFGACMRA